MFTGFWIGKPPVVSKFRRPLLIWDVDGTLLELSGVGRQALNQAFLSLHHISEAFDQLDFAGATDHALYRQAVDHFLNDQGAAEPSRFFQVYLDRLRVLLTHAPITPLPGVPALLALLSRAGWSMVLGTGNIRAGAYRKLGRVGLANYFPGGGFSTPGCSRADLLRTARETAPPDTPAVVLGDTPRDVEAARQLGLPVIAVATGRYAPDQLASCGADQVVETLEDRDRLASSIIDLIEQSKGSGGAP